jgi:hypothetical protein
MDFAFSILPWSVILRLNMKRKEKFTVLSGLSLGILAGVCSSIRTYELQTLSSHAEYVFDTAPMLLWSTTEILVTIICACVPVLRPLYIQLRHRSHNDSSSGGRSYPLKDYDAKKHSSGTFGSGARPKGSKGTDTNKLYLGPRASALQPTVQMGSDNASEESILREQRLPIQGAEANGRGILRTDEIVMTTASAV